MQHANYVVNIFAINRQSGVLCTGYLLEHFFHVIFYIKPRHFIARYHNLVYLHFFEVEDIQQHALSLFRQSAF